MPAPKKRTKKTEPIVSPLADPVEFTKEELPHLYGRPWYSWAKSFFDDESRNAFLVAPNQVSKTCTLARKIIDLATNPERQQRIWGKVPNTFWILFPSKEQCTTEWEQKWKKEWMPCGRAKDSKQYGWTETYEYKKIHTVEFNSGVTLYWKSYEQAESALQSSTVYFIGLDEEPPVSLWPELTMRRDAVDGLINFVFTPTKSQRFFWEIMECVGKPNERFPNAFKRHVSLYDCQKYLDGTPSRWTKEKIDQRISECGSEKEILRRVMGRFVLESKEVFSTFDEKRNVLSVPYTKLEGEQSYLGVFFGKEQRTGVVLLHKKSDSVKVRISYANIFTLPPLQVQIAIEAMLGKIKPLRYVNKDATDFIRITESAGFFHDPISTPKPTAAGIANSLFATENLDILEFDQRQELISQIVTCKIDDFQSFLSYELIGAMLLVLKKIHFSFLETIKGAKPIIDKLKGLNEREVFWRGLDRPESHVDSTEEEFNDFNESLDF